MIKWQLPYQAVDSGILGSDVKKEFQNVIKEENAPITANTAEVKDFKFTVNSVKKVKDLSGAKPETGDYLLINITVANIANLDQVEQGVKDLIQNASVSPGLIHLKFQDGYCSEFLPARKGWELSKEAIANNCLYRDYGGAEKFINAKSLFPEILETVNFPAINEKIPPGKSITTVIVFDVPANVSSAQLIVEHLFASVVRKNILLVF